MRHTAKTLIAGIATVFVMALGIAGSAAQDASVKSLRGGVEVQDATPAPLAAKQDTKGRFGRAYRQQPPLIPHRIRGYQIDAKVNQCMHCHDWPNNVEEGAPKVSETHYVDRNGVALDHVARTRWFCNQCHVPQANAKPLVSNTFKSSTQVD